MRPKNARALATAGAVSLATMGLVTPVTAAPQSEASIAAVHPAATPTGPPLVLEYEQEFGGPSVFPKGVEASSWLRQPIGIAIDPLDPSHVYVAAGDKVVRWSSHDGRTDTYAQPGVGRIADVVAVPVSDSSVRLVVTDMDRYPGDPNYPVDPIMYTDSWGSPFKPLPKIVGTGAGVNEFDEARAVSLGPDRRLYIADTGNMRVQVVELHDGQSVRSWGGEGKGPGKFRDPCGIAVGPDGSVYVSDEGADRQTISKFTSDGTFVTSWLSAPPGSGWRSPWGMDVGPDGNLYVIHFFGGVSVFSPDGELLTSFGTRGPYDGAHGPGEFAKSAGIAVAPDGRVYVGDGGNFRVQVLRPSLTGAPVNVSGAVKVGSTLTVSGEQWSVTPTGVSYQWLRGSAPISGATGRTYKPVLADVGHRLSVRVVASKAGGEPAYADATVTSPATAAVPPVTSSVQLSASKKKQVFAAKSPVTLTADVAVAAGGATAGAVQFRHGAAVLGSVTVSASGNAQLTLPRKLAVGSQSLTAHFVPSSAEVARSTSSALAIKVTKAPAKVSTKLLKAKVATSSRARLRVKVKVTGIAKPTGKVKVTWTKGKKKTSKTFSIKAKRRGVIIVKLPRLAKGKYKVRTTYQGSKTIKKKKGKVRTLKVRSLKVR